MGRRVCDVNVRMQGAAYRQLYQHMEKEVEKERVLFMKQRGIMRKIVDTNTRFMGMGYNKLVESWKASQNACKERLKFIIKSLSDKDAKFTVMAYNQLKQRKLMLDGVGFGDDNATKLKIRLIRKITDSSYNFQCQAMTAFKEFLVQSREAERLAAEEAERQRKEKDKILRRVCNVQLRQQGQAYRQLYQHMEAEVEKERVLMMKQRGIMRKIVDSNTRFMGMGYNKLVESW